MDDCPATVNERQAALDQLYAEIWQDDTNGAERPAQRRPRNSQTCDDDALPAKTLKAWGGHKLRALWQGDASGYPSQSEADLALCGLLAFWTGPDPERIDRLFRRSDLCRGKWKQREDYGRRTIAKALKARTEYYHPEQPERPPAPGVNSSGATQIRGSLCNRREPTCRSWPGSDSWNWLGGMALRGRKTI